MERSALSWASEILRVSAAAGKADAGTSVVTLTGDVSSWTASHRQPVVYELPTGSQRQIERSLSPQRDELARVRSSVDMQGAGLNARKVVCGVP
jgi:hypothetical protein